MLGQGFQSRTKFGRLMYGTKSQAMSVARKLGLSGTHSHMMEGQRVYMPGTNHKSLNDALRERGMRPTPMPGDGGGMMSGDGMMGSASSSNDDDSLLGGMGGRDRDRDGSMLDGFDGMGDDRDRDRPSAFESLRDDRDRDRDRGTGLGDLAAGAVGLGFGLAALDALDGDGGDGSDGLGDMDVDFGGFDG